MKYDLIIVGGGLVGAGLAVALRELDIKIALIDARLPNQHDPRLFALNSSSCQFLANLAIWPQISAHACAIQQVHVSHAGHFGAVRLRHDTVNLPSLGHVVPARYIESALQAALLTASNITLYQPAKLVTLQQHEQDAELVVDTEQGRQTFSTSLVIAADGTQSTVRAQLDIATYSHDYAQQALVTRTLLKRSHQHIAYERFTKNGVIAMLPLAENECATIWTADKEAINELAALSEQSFLAALQQQFGYRLGRLQSIKQRHVFPLHMVRAEKMTKGSVFLLGNAAHTLHPVAAQGFNLALYEVAALVEAISEKIKCHELITCADLEKISLALQAQQTSKITMSHQLAHWFSSDKWLSNAGLQMGMLMMDMITPVKKQFINTMLSRNGRVPSLLLTADKL